MKYFTALLALFLLGLVACGGGRDKPASATPTGDEIAIALTTNPNPPASGQIELNVTLTDSTGQMVDNAEVYVLAGHTGMGGMNVEGDANKQQNGRYTLVANLSMAGDWLITVEVRGISAETIRQEFNLSVKQ